MNLVVLLEKAFSDSARAAAVEARRKKGKGGSKGTSGASSRETEQFVSGRGSSETELFISGEGSTAAEKAKEMSRNASKGSRVNPDLVPKHLKAAAIEYNNAKGTDKYEALGTALAGDLNYFVESNAKSRSEKIKENKKAKLAVKIRAAGAAARKKFNADRIKAAGEKTRKQLDRSLSGS